MLTKLPVVRVLVGYKVGITGESHRQREIATTRSGERVRLVHDAKNKFDRRAVAVINRVNKQIGFLPRGGWLTAAILDEDQEVRATVSDIYPPSAECAYYAVVLDVELCGPRVSAIDSIHRK
jgi:hypothetical protein